MKNSIYFFSIFFIAFFLSCTSSTDDIKSPRDSFNIINVSSDEIMDFGKDFEDEFGIYNLTVDNQRAIFIDIGEDKLYIPVNNGFYYIENSTLNSGNPEIKIKEVHGGIKFTVARKNPREDPSKCKGDCKCGVGFRCGSTKSVKIKLSDKVNFDTVDRVAVGKHYLDFENNYYIIEFVTIMDWKMLQNE